MLNFRLILFVLGALLGIEAIFIAISGAVAAYYGGSDMIPLFSSAGICLTIGGFLLLINKNVSKKVGRKDAYFIVAIGWFIMSLAGTLPFLIHGSIPKFADAFFETVSGFTTTGSTTLDNIESLPNGLLFWRSTTQWIGGMGIIVLAIAVMPFIKIGGMQMFIAEVPGVSHDKLKPRVAETAKRLWIIYIGLTILEVILLKFAGMTLFDAVNHSFTTMATGGYSTKQANIGHFHSPAIEYIIIAFMFIAGANFTLIYYGIKFKLKKIFSNDEFKFYLFIVLFASAIIATCLMVSMDYSVERSIREALFQVVSVITTTGYSSVDYLQWVPSHLWVILLLLMLIGGSAGSTSGGIKVVRVLISLRNSFIEMKRIINPNAIIPVRYNKQGVSSNIISHVTAFVFLYLIIFIFSSIIMTFFGVDFISSLGACASSLGNVGVATGVFGPAYTYSTLPDIPKYFQAFLMLLGRLELFTILVIFSPYFWKK